MHSIPKAGIAQRTQDLTCAHPSEGIAFPRLNHGDQRTDDLSAIFSAGVIGQQSASKLRERFQTISRFELEQ